MYYIIFTLPSGGELGKCRLDLLVKYAELQVHYALTVRICRMPEAAINNFLPGLT